MPGNRVEWGLAWPAPRLQQACEALEASCKANTAETGPAIGALCAALDEPAEALDGQLS